MSLVQSMVDADTIINKIHRAEAELHDHRNDGYTQFAVKMELYKIKFALDEVMRDSPEFAGEEHFLAEEEKKKIWRTLKK